MVKFFFDLIEKEMHPGQQIADKYEIESVLGKGSYGLTYLVKNLNDESFAVLKQNRKRKRKKGIQSFQNEVKILDVIDHPSIPKLLDFFKWGDSYFIVMELKEGKTVEQLIFEEGYIFSENESFHLLRQILEIVKVIHNKGIVHLDLRTPNILLQDGKINIIDFGLAKLMTDTKEKSFKRNQFKQSIIKDDFYELGHFLLFMLYSGFEPGPNNKKRDSWQNELSLSPKAKMIIEKLLEIKQPYESIEELISDIDIYLENSR